MRTPLRRFCLPLVLLCTFVSLSAAAVSGDDAIPLDRNGLPQWVVKEWIDAPIRLELPDRGSLDALLDAVPLADFSREAVGVVWDTPKSYHVVLELRATEDEIEALAAAGYRPLRLPDLDRAGREEAERTWAEMAAKGISPVKYDPYDYYPTHAQVGTILADIETNYPNLARTFQWGSSVQGRELWGIVLSNNVQSSEAEPEVCISSSMHGDEVVGIVLCLNLAHELTENYGLAGQDSITYLMDNYEIHLLPMHNPDGTVLTQRYNANGVDLNRNFGLPAGTHTVREIENVHYENYCNSNHFVTGLNYHGGALVVNYPWDWTYTLSPDNDALIQHSLEYSTWNLPMYNGSFPQGITNGAEWYVITGSLQDWVYDQTDAINITLEVSNTKWPSASTLTTFWGQNRASMMHFIRSARYGVNGVVSASDTGLPLDAEVTVVGNSIEVHTDPNSGDYYKLLDTGTYDLTFTADGYIDQTVYGVSTTWGTPTVLDVVMQPVAHGDITGYVYETGGAPIDAQINVYTHPLGTPIAVVQSSAAAAGAFTVPGLVYGEYRLVYTAVGHISDEQLVTLDAASVAAPDMTLAIAEEVVLFASDFESGSDGWLGTWQAASPGHGGAQGMTDSPTGSYDNYEDNPCTLAEGLDLSDIVEGELSFWCNWQIENMWDGVQFLVSIDGGSAWTPLASTYTDNGSGQGAQASGEPYYDGTQSSWVRVYYDLAPWLGESDVRFRFHLVSDSSVEYDGFRFDDFLVEGIRESDPGTGAQTPMAATRVAGAHPNPFNPSTKIAYATPRDGHVTLSIYDVTGRRVRILVDGHVVAGEHAAHWDGRTDTGLRAASGVYFARVAGADAVDSIKLMLVK